MNRDDAPTVRHACASWILSSGENALWVCRECGGSANDISWIVPREGRDAAYPEYKNTGHVNSSDDKIKSWQTGGLIAR